jgi:hypothetical protein
LLAGAVIVDKVDNLESYDPQCPQSDKPFPRRKGQRVESVDIVDKWTTQNKSLTYNICGVFTTNIQSLAI